ncbi:unnamed protein product, partial [Symbiodinium microadriaticum]
MTLLGSGSWTPFVDSLPALRPPPLAQRPVPPLAALGPLPPVAGASHCHGPLCGPWRDHPRNRSSATAPAAHLGTGTAARKSASSAKPASCPAGTEPSAGQEEWKHEELLT